MKKKILAILLISILIVYVPPKSTKVFDKEFCNILVEKILNV